MTWAKVSSEFFYNPKILAARWPAREIYLYLLLRNRSCVYNGDVPQRDVTSRVTELLLQVTAEQHDAAIERLAQCDLISVEGGVIHITGWSDEWANPIDGGERSRRWRAKSAKRRDKRASVTDRNASVTDRNASVTDAQRDVTHETELETETEIEKETEDRRRVARPAREASPPDPESIEIAQHLYDAIRSHTPDFLSNARPADTARKLSGWAGDIAKAIRIDGRSADELKAVVDAAHRNAADPFWRANLLSGKKLREKFDQIEIKSRSQRRTVPGLTAREIWDLAQTERKKHEQRDESGRDGADRSAQGTLPETAIGAGDDRGLLRMPR